LITHWLGHARPVEKSEWLQVTIISLGQLKCSPYNHTLSIKAILCGIVTVRHGSLWKSELEKYQALTKQATPEPPGCAPTGPKQAL
jgi:hypothetical protein